MGREATRKVRVLTDHLLDTHAALWWWTNNPRLGSAARRLLEEHTSRIFLSAACVWEIAIKSHAGRLPEIVDFAGQYPHLMRENGFVVLPISDRHALAGGYLAGKHRDPFDRVIAAQALAEDLTVITRDPEIAAFGCKVVW